MFYPDFADGWQAHFHLAVRINRLGKSVSRKFAPRYYDAVAPAMFIAPSAPDLCTSGWLNAMDNSITHGAWTAPDSPLRLTVSISSSSAAPLSVTLDSTDIDIPGAIVECSRITTLRTGDIILLPLSGSPDVSRAAALPLRPRSRITSSPPDLLNVKIV